MAATASQMPLFSERAPAETPRAAAADIADDFAQAQIAITEAAGMNGQDGTDLCSEIERVLGEMNRRADEDLQHLRALHAKILRIPLEQLDGHLEAERAKEQAAKQERKAARPAAPPRAKRGAKGEGPPTARLTDRQRELLAQFDVSENVARFRSSEHIGDWTAIKAVFVALGAKWRTGKPGGFVFPENDDGAEKVRLALATGEIFDPKAAGFFPTPAPLAKRLVELAQIKPGDHVLEPSAGRGSIALAAREAGAEVYCVEFLPDNVIALMNAGLKVNESDFLSLRPSAVYDVAAMNPPFGDRQDIAHIRHAFEFLKPGGRLVSVASAGVQYRDDQLARDFREWVAANEGAIDSLPEGSFLESGTGVRTCVVRMRRAA